MKYKEIVASFFKLYQFYFILKVHRQVHFFVYYLDTNDLYMYMDIVFSLCLKLGPHGNSETRSLNNLLIDSRYK